MKNWIIMKIWTKLEKEKINYNNLRQLLLKLIKMFHNKMTIKEKILNWKYLNLNLAIQKMKVTQKNLRMMNKSINLF